MTQLLSSPTARLERLQSFLAQDPDNLNLLADIADIALQDGKVDVARTAIGHALILQPNDLYFRLRLSSAAIAERKFDEAIGLTQKLLDEGQSDAAIRFNHAYTLMSLLNYEAAAALFEQLSADPQVELNVACLLMRCQHYLGQMGKAIEVGLAHMQKHPGDNVCAGMLGLLYFDMNDLAQAEVWAKRSLESGADNIDALLVAGGAALGMEDPEVAKGFLQRAIDLQPSNGRAWTSLGLVDMLESDLGGAEQKLSYAVQCMSGHLGSWVALGWTQLMQGKLEAAERSFLRAFDLDDTFAEIHSGLAAVAAVRDDMAQAEAHAKTARRLNPTAISAQYPQIVTLLREGCADDAKRLVQAALQRGQAPMGGTLLDMVRRVGAKRART